MPRLFNAIVLAAPVALLLVATTQPAAARDKCIAVMQLVGVPANVSQQSDEVGEDKNGDGEIWTSVGGGRMIGFLDCSDVPGSTHGDTYEQNYTTGDTHKTGNSQASGQLGRKWFNEAEQRSVSSGSGGSGSTNRGSSTASDDSRPPAGKSPIAKKKKPIAQRQ